MQFSFKKSPIVRTLVTDNKQYMQAYAMSWAIHSNNNIFIVSAFMGPLEK